MERKRISDRLYYPSLAAWSRDAALKKKTENPEKWEEHLDK
jgi:hypothetical protein